MPWWLTVLLVIIIVAIPVSIVWYDYKLGERKHNEKDDIEEFLDHLKGGDDK